MWWATFNHFGWVYCYTNSFGRLVFAVEEFHEVLVNAQWAVQAPLMSQHLLRQHIEHMVMHIARNDMVPCTICSDQELALLNIETYNPSMDLAYINREGYIDERLG